MADKRVSLRGPDGPVEVVYRDNGDGTYSEAGVNIGGTALASAARTATTNSADIVNYRHRGIILFLNVTVAGVDGGITINLQAKDPVSGSYFTTYAAAAPVTNTGLKAYNLYPGAAGAGNYTNTAQQELPQTFRIGITVANATSYTYSIGYQLIM